MKILITGATGFLGDSLVKSLIGDTYNIAVMSRITSDISSLDRISKNISIFKFSGHEEINSIFTSFRPDIIIHTACCYDRNGASKEQIFEANYYLGKELVKSAMRLDKEIFFLNMATAMPKNLNLYTESKSIFSTYGQSKNNTSGLNFIDIYLQFFYGIEDKSSSFVMKLIDACLLNKSSFQLTSGVQKRDFIYIDDLLSALHLVLKKIHLFKEINFLEIGSGESITIKDFAELIKRLAKSNTKLDFSAVPLRDNEPMECIADINQLTDLGWRPMYNLNNGI